MSQELKRVSTFWSKCEKQYQCPQSHKLPDVPPESVKYSDPESDKARVELLRIKQEVWLGFNQGS